jgi:hypothetical protein
VVEAEIEKFIALAPSTHEFTEIALKKLELQIRNKLNLNPKGGL